MKGADRDSFRGVLWRCLKYVCGDRLILWLEAHELYDPGGKK